MKKIYIIALSALLPALMSCSKEEPIQPSIDFSSPYVIKDDPSDPIQHHRYEIYSQYGVPVFFHDTIASTYIGEDSWGDAIYRYETLDFNWNFSSHNGASVKYIYEYIEDAPTQELALEFVDEFLKQAPEPMRPFSIFLPKTFSIRSNSGTSEPEFWGGFRTLVIPGVDAIDKNHIPEFTEEVLMSMVKDKVLNNDDLVEEFGEVSEKNKYYGKQWVVDLKCKWGVEHLGTFWNPSALWEPGQAEYYVMYSFQTFVYSVEEFNAERDLIFRQIGQFGFINGDDKNRMGYLMSPSKVSEDLSYYVDQMLELGAEEFEKRYCASPLVEQKYKIISDFINNELGVKY